MDIDPDRAVGGAPGVEAGGARRAFKRGRAESDSDGDGFDTDEAPRAFAAARVAAVPAASPAERLLAVENTMFGITPPKLETLEAYCSSPACDHDLVIQAIENYRSKSITGVWGRLGNWLRGTDPWPAYRNAIWAASANGIRVPEHIGKDFIDTAYDVLPGEPLYARLIVSINESPASILESAREIVAVANTATGDRLFGMARLLKAAGHSVFDPNGQAYLPGIYQIVNKLSDAQILELTEADPVGDGTVFHGVGSQDDLREITRSLDHHGAARVLALNLSRTNDVGDTILHQMAAQDQFGIPLRIIFRKLTEAGFSSKIIEASRVQNKPGDTWMHVSGQRPLTWFVAHITRQPLDEFPADILKLTNESGEYWFGDFERCQQNDMLLRLAQKMPLEDKIAMARESGGKLWFWAALGERGENLDHAISQVAGMVNAAMLELGLTAPSDRWGRDSVGSIFDCWRRCDVAGRASPDSKRLADRIKSALEYCPPRLMADFYASMEPDQLDAFLEIYWKFFSAETLDVSHSKFLLGLFGDRHPLGAELQKEFDSSHGRGGQASTSLVCFIRVLNKLSSATGFRREERELCEHLRQTLIDSLAFINLNQKPDMGLWAEAAVENVAKNLHPSDAEGYVEVTLFNAGLGARQHHYVVPGTAQSRGHTDRTYKVQVAELRSLDFWTGIEETCSDVSDNVNSLYAHFEAADERCHRHGIAKSTAVFRRENFLDLLLESHFVGIHIDTGHDSGLQMVEPSYFQERGNCYVATTMAFLEVAVMSLVKDRTELKAFSANFKEAARKAFPEVSADPRFRELMADKTKKSEVRRKAMELAANERTFAMNAGLISKSMNLEQLAEICSGNGLRDSDMPEDNPHALLEWMKSARRSDRERQQLMVYFLNRKA